MPLEKDRIIRKFLSVSVPLEQLPHCYHGTEDQFTLKFNKSPNPDYLSSILFTFPPLDEEHASRYGLLISLFWLGVLPEGVPLIPSLRVDPA